MSAWRRSTAVLFMTLGIAACAGNAPPPPNSAQTEPASVATLPDAAAAESTPEPVKTATPPPIPVPDAETFLNRNGVEIAEILGEPGFVRKDPPAELWQYRTGACTLDLYFYDEGAGAYALEWLDFRGTDGTSAARDACLREILRQKTS